MKLHQSILEHWHCRFDDLQLSSDDFYTALERTIAAHQLPGMRTYRTNIAEGGILCPKRQYLSCMQDGGLQFLICAAPYGTTFFISWWLKSYTGVRAAIYPLIPFIGRRLTESLYKQTYYEADETIMFKETIKHLVDEAVQDISNTKGIRVTGRTETAFA